MNTNLRTVRSKDGTSIAYEEFGAGPPLMLVHGGISDRTYWAPVVPAFAERFTVLTVDPRGRGASGDATSYAIDREFEDVAAVVDAIDEPVHLLGHSYGGICALEAALRTLNLATLMLYEPALDRAAELMMREIVGLPVEALAELRADAAAWQPMVDCVHTARYRALDVPTVLLAGTDSPPELHVGVGLVRDAVDGARVVTMQGVDHEAVTTGPDVLAATLMDLLAGSSHDLRGRTPDAGPHREIGAAVEQADTGEVLEARRRYEARIVELHPVHLPTRQRPGLATQAGAHPEPLGEKACDRSERPGELDLLADRQVVHVARGAFGDVHGILLFACREWRCES